MKILHDLCPLITVAFQLGLGHYFEVKRFVRVKKVTSRRLKCSRQSSPL